MWDLLEVSTLWAEVRPGRKCIVAWEHCETHEVRRLEWFSSGAVVYQANGASVRSQLATFRAPVWEREDMALLTMLVLPLSLELAGKPWSAAYDHLSLAASSLSWEA